MSGSSVGKQEQPEGHYVDLRRIALLESLQNEDQTWAKLAPRWCVTNPDPPWQVCLDATCDALSAGGALDSLERRHAEDELGETVYSALPNPERQLLALAHIMLSRGLLTEDELARQIRTVRARLEETTSPSSSPSALQPRAASTVGGERTRGATRKHREGKRERADP